MRLMRAIAIAFSTYSRIPMPRVDWSEENQRYSMCFFPLVGLAVGLALWLWLWLCDLWARGAFARGAIGAALPLLVSGGIHMDGFMDTLDAMASWQPREKRLEILKDVHTGAFAVMGCGAYLLAMAGILSEARADQGLAIAACFVLSRALSALALVWFPKARKGGMLAGFARTAQEKAVTGACCAYIALCAAAFLCAQPLSGALALAAAGLCAAYYFFFSRKYFGGTTGDIAGWFLQISELVTLAVTVLIGGRLL